MPALALEIQHGIDHMLDHARPRDLPVLGDMPHKNHGNTAPFGKACQLVRGGADLTDGPGGGIDVIGPHGLYRIDDDQIGLHLFKCGQDIAQIGFGGQLHRGVGQPQTLRPHTDLRRGFLSADVDCFQTAAGKMGRCLQQKGGFPDARIAAHQNGRGRDQPAAQNAIQLGNAGLAAGRGRVLGGEVGQHHRRTATGAKRFAGRAG